MSTYWIAILSAVNGAIYFANAKAVLFIKNMRPRNEIRARIMKSTNIGKATKVIDCFVNQLGDQ